MQKKCGRPKKNTYLSAIYIPETNSVMLTEKQYKTLLERYGSKLLAKAVLLLDDWLNLSPYGSRYKGANNYAHFRSDGWVINEAKRLITQQI